MNSLIVLLLCLLWNCKSETKVKEKPVDLTELGKNITDTITKPSGAPDDLIGNIYQYYEALAIMHIDMKKGVKEAMNAFYELKNQGGPPFLELLPVDEKPLEKFYKWKRYHGIEFRGFLKYNQDEWTEINEFANKSASALGNE